VLHIPPIHQILYFLHLYIICFRVRVIRRIIVGRRYRSRAGCPLQLLNLFPSDAFVTPRDSTDRRGSVHDIRKVHGIVLVEIEPLHDADVIGVHLPARPQHHAPAHQRSFKAQQQPHGKQYAANRHRETVTEHFKDGMSLLVKSVGPVKFFFFFCGNGETSDAFTRVVTVECRRNLRRHHTAIGSSQCQSGPHDAQDRRVRYDQYVATERRHDDGVVDAAYDAGHVHVLRRPPIVVGRREFDEHGDVQAGEDGRLRSDGHQGRVVQIEFLLLQGCGLLLQGALQLQLVGGQHADDASECELRIRIRIVND